MSVELKHTVNEEDEIDLKQLFSRLMDKKLTIFVVFLLTILVGSYIAYFATPIYETSAVLRIQEDAKNSKTDMLQMAMEGMSNTEIDTEIGILQSKSLIELALNQVPFNVRYFKKENLKTKEIYQESPFSVHDFKILDEKFFGKWFLIKNEDNNSFTLQIKQSLLEKYGVKESIVFNEKFHYGERVQTKYFSFTVNKESEFTKGEYSFLFNTNRSIIDQIILPNLQVAQVGKKGSLVQITYQDNIPERAEKFTNALANAYIQQSIDFNTEEASKTLSFIEDQLRDVKKNLEESALGVENFKQTHNTMDISAETKTSIEKLSAYDQQLAQIEIEADQAKRIEQLLKKGDFSALSIAPMQLSDNLVSSLMLSLSEAERKKKTLMVEYTERHPEVVQQTLQIERLKKEILSNLGSLQQGIAERKQSIQKVIDRNEVFFKKLPETERQYVERARTFEVNEKIYSFLLEKQSESSIAKASTVSNNRVVDPALLPLKPIKPKKSLILAVSAILGLILGVLIALLRDFLDDSIKSIDDIRKETDIPLVGTIPFIKEAIDSRHLVLENPKSVYAESFRAMRTNLQFMATYANHKVIMVTSTLPGEGKTTTASNLGTILALSDKKVVIINLDLRLPTLHQVFGLGNEKGMSNYLSGHASVSEIIQKTAVENLDIISSGAVPPNPSELIMSERMKEALSELRGMYDYVILDTPPIGLVTDGLILANEADITLFVLRVNRAKRGFAARFDRTARAHDIKHTGIILSAVPASKGSGGYGGYGYGGYGYGYGYGGYGEYGQESEVKKSLFQRLTGR
ncbi:MAG: polysaccharide biosynthesis tyrosine autokinase [Sulfuricurvum sp.]|jgi:capsular exopolysaccharide synthesis family protein|uniref:GumC family protein n=1 Tax=Sulfuricurvum sp. TaxID=2025608 RepID=UPI0025E6C717|nr:polysaccharide biosynthesis tyrosine autokinase [Sulfuricurvum sp.]MCK9372296.1 polysaccharide biosynthesis tyrosine autokinase [Sulfuricurvum sp.]